MVCVTICEHPPGTTQRLWLRAHAAKGRVECAPTLACSCASCCTHWQLLCPTVCDISGHTAGEMPLTSCWGSPFHLGFASVTTDASGNSVFDVSLSNRIWRWEAATATATESQGSSSPSTCGRKSRDVEADTTPRESWLISRQLTAVAAILTQPQTRTRQDGHLGKKETKTTRPFWKMTSAFVNAAV